MCVCVYALVFVCVCVYVCVVYMHVSYGSHLYYLSLMRTRAARTCKSDG